MTKELYYQQILKLIGEGKTEYALDLLEQCAKEHNIEDLIPYITVYKARLSRITSEKSKGTIELSQYNIELNQINDAIITSIKVLREEPVPLSIGESVRYGCIAHNIPHIMSRGVTKYCKVRIAKLDELLFDKNFRSDSVSTPEKLELTERMEVELYDPTGGQAFAIEPVNRELVQLVEDHAPTEWKFRVTPLLEGAHQLELRAFLFKQKGKKELSFETQIDVVAYDGEFYAKLAITPWQVNDKVIDLGENTESKSKKGLLALLANSALAKAAMVIGAFLLTGLGYLLYHRHNPTINVPPVPLPSKYQIRVKVDSKLKAQTVLLTKDTITDWTANQDTSEIYLPAQKVGKYLVTIKGSNGICSKLISLSSDSTFTLDCNIIEPPKPPVIPEDKPVNVPKPPKPQPKPKPKPRFDIGILTPFRAPIILVNGVTVSGRKTPPEDKNFKTTINLEEGQYRISAIDRSNMYNCYDKNITLNASNQSILFDCFQKVKPVETTTLIIKSEGQFATENLPETYLKINGVKVSSDRLKQSIQYREKRGRAYIKPYLQIEVLKVPIGTEIQISIGKSSKDYCYAKFTPTREKNVLELPCDFVIIN